MKIKASELRRVCGDIVNRCPRCDGVVFYSSDEEHGTCLRCGEDIIIIQDGGEVIDQTGEKEEQSSC